jgi:hypothetical protein
LDSFAWFVLLLEHFVRIDAPAIPAKPVLRNSRLDVCRILLISVPHFYHILFPKDMIVKHMAIINKKAFRA